MAAEGNELVHKMCLSNIVLEGKSSRLTWFKLRWQSVVAAFDKVPSVITAM